MGDERDNFFTAGPKHLTVVDWGNDDHRRSVAASLVKSVYIMERDRETGRSGSCAFNTAWWEFFQFRLTQQLVDEADQSIFGAVFEYLPNASSTYGFPDSIVAFRGTMLNSDCVGGDISHDIQVLLNRLHTMPRAKIAFDVVNGIVSNTANKDTWLAGHSLGASIALVVGQQMATLSNGSTNLESFLFNPPYPSLPIEGYFKNQKVANGFRVGKTIFKAALEKLTMEGSSFESASDAAVAKWVPYLFLHPSDLICSEYIGYFATKRQMVQLWMGRVVALSSRHSFGGLISSTFSGKADRAMHLIHSARLIVNKRPESTLKKAHSLDQWWSSDLQLDKDDHLYA